MDDDYSPGYGTLLPILGWMMTNDWMPSYEGHTDEFYQELADDSEFSVGEILSVLPTVLWTMAMQACFEDFLTCEYESSPSNPIEQYLAERGSNLSDIDVEFITRFRKSVIRLYKVVARTPDGSIEFTDLLGDAKTIVIQDETATSTLVVGDTVATRIVSIDSKDYLAGVVFPFPQSLINLFMEGYEHAFKEELKEVGAALRSHPGHRRIVQQKVLKHAAPLSAYLWITGTFEILDSVLPIEDNSESNYQARMVADASPNAIADQLDDLIYLVRPFPKQFIWFWHVDRMSPDRKLKAIIWLSGSEVLLEGGDLTQLEEVVVNLQELLGDAVGDAEIGDFADQFEDDPDWIISDDDEDEDGDNDEDGDGDKAPLLVKPLPGEDESDFRKRVHAYFDSIYRILLDTDVDGLGNKVPRDLARTVKGQKQLVKWISSLESYHAAHAGQPGIGDYDPRWIWKELGVENLRQSSLFE